MKYKIIVTNEQCTLCADYTDIDTDAIAIADRLSTEYDDNVTIKVLTYDSKRGEKILASKLPGETEFYTEEDRENMVE